MINYIIQLSIWLLAYFYIGRSGYLANIDSIKWISLLRSGLFLALSFFINGLSNIWFLTVLPSFGILAMNFLFEPKIKGKPGLFCISILLQILIVVSAFVFKDIFTFNYFDLISSAKTEKGMVLKFFSVIVCLTPANLIIRVILDKFLTPELDKSKFAENKMNIENPGIVNSKESLERAGRLIGNIERVLTLGLLYTGQYEAIGFIIAAKSIIRTREAKADSE